jgi:hypothetical protein
LDRKWTNIIIWPRDRASISVQQLRITWNSTALLSIRTTHKCPNHAAHMHWLLTNEQTRDQIFNSAWGALDQYWHATLGPYFSTLTVAQLSQQLQLWNFNNKCHTFWMSIVAIWWCCLMKYPTGNLITTWSLDL